jgi:hypothetical protein
MKIQLFFPSRFRAPSRLLLRLLPVFFALLTLPPIPKANAQNAASMAQVQRVFARRTQGNAFFNRSLRAALRTRGLQFTSNPKRADAWLDTSGFSSKDGGFVGEMTFIGRGGKVLRREKVTRPANSRTMAYRSLAQKVRFGSAAKAR